MGTIGSIGHWPAYWGVLGAFAYAATRLLPCLVASAEAGHSRWLCAAEFVISLTIGGIAAAAFSRVGVGLFHIKDLNAIGALIGFLANPCAPTIAAAAPAMLSAALKSSAARALKGDNK